jgi:hypothetical protein
VLFGTYQSSLFKRFWDLGVDFTDGHALAEFLAEHPGAKPLLGFARRHREDPRVQRELDVALAYCAGKGNEKGVQLCMRAGANPNTPACDLRYPQPCPHTAADRAGEEGEETAIQWPNFSIPRTTRRPHGWSYPVEFARIFAHSFRRDFETGRC